MPGATLRMMQTNKTCFPDNLKLLPIFPSAFQLNCRNKFSLFVKSKTVIYILHSLYICNLHKKSKKKIVTDYIL